MRILVTGGAGFIGSHLCERLISGVREVLCLDNFFTGRRDNILHLLDDARFELMRHDVTEPVLLEVDQIYNLACPASPVHYQYNPVKTAEDQRHGHDQHARSRETRARPHFAASTSEVYGDPLVHPQTEDYWGHVNPIGLRSCYDEGKRIAETLDDGLSPAERRRHPHRAHLQHLWATNAGERRPRGVQLHGSGTAQRAADVVWRRRTDALFLLRRRSSRGADPADER